jgi:RNA-binding protein 25
MAKQYEREDDVDRTQKKNRQKEAKKMAQFLEDYNDDRDDPKYYKLVLFLIWAINSTIF